VALRVAAGGHQVRNAPLWPSPPNEPFCGWSKTFTDPRLSAAIVERLILAAKEVSQPANLTALILGTVRELWLRS
jgi:hypothetical protein